MEVEVQGSTDIPLAGRGRVTAPHAASLTPEEGMALLLVGDGASPDLAISL